MRRLAPDVNGWAAKRKFFRVNTWDPPGIV
jgi:hypothetical protein